MVAAAADHPGRVRVRRRRDDDDNGGGAFSSLVDLATAGGLNFALFTLLRLGRRSCWSWWSRCSAATRWPARRAGAACATCWRSRCRGPGCSASSWSWRWPTRPLALLLLVGTALLAGTLRYGWNPLRTTIAAEIPRGRGAAAAAAASRLPRRDPAGGGRRWRSCSRCSTDAPLGAVGGAVLLCILSSILDQITALGVDPQLPADPLQRRLARAAVHAGADRRHGPRRDLGAALRGALLGLAFWRFIRKDVVSS